jgi:2-polyprenyl-3-methyl-5-hydroxy-6-metoxy-1,4-benzoquinol methylase
MPMNDAKAHWIALRQQLKQYDIRLGTASAQDYVHDPKHLTFVASRYKFVAKMMHRLGCVIEVGCGDAFGAPIIAQSVDRLICLDIDDEVLRDNTIRCAPFTNITFENFDLGAAPYPTAADVNCLLDVLQHVEPSEEARFIANLAGSVGAHGVAIIGTPNVTAHAYASPNSKLGHINLKSGEELRALCKQYFHNVFMFGMNDEVVHAGYLPMAHYLIALCAHPLRDA